MSGIARTFILVLAVLASLSAGVATVTAASPPPGLQSRPALAAGTDVVALWEDTRDGATHLVWSRFVLPALPVVDAARLTADAANELRPDVAARADLAMAVWESWTDAGVSVRAARIGPLDAPGSSLATVAAPASASEQRRPAVAVAAAGAVILWEETVAGRSAILAARWDDGDPAPVPLGPLDPAGLGAQYHARITPFGTGYLAVWSERPAGGNTRIRARLLDATGVPVGAPMEVTDGALVADNPDVAGGAGHGLVVWNEYAPAGLRVSGARIDAGSGGVAVAATVLLEEPSAIAHSPRAAAAGEGFWLAALVQEGGERMAVRAWVDTALVATPSGGGPLTDPADQVADLALVTAGEETVAAWRLPLPGDDDDLWAGRWEAADPTGPVAATLLATAPEAAVAGLPDAAPPVALRVHPNPSRGTVRILRGSPAAGAGETLPVLDAGGRRVATIRFPGGGDTAVWDGRGEDGSVLPAGVYFLRTGPGRGLRLIRVP